MNSTQATVIIADADKAQAQADLSEYQFTVPLSASGEAPATNWMSSGWWYDSQLNDIVNVFTWPKQIYFGSDWQSAIAQAGLQVIPEVAQAADQTEGA